MLCTQSIIFNVYLFNNAIYLDNYAVVVGRRVTVPEEKDARLYTVQTPPSENPVRHHKGTKLFFFFFGGGVGGGVVAEEEKCQLICF